MFCPKCGTETPTDALFCHKCGKSLVSETSNEKTNVEPKPTKARITYDFSDEPTPYSPPSGIQLQGVRRQIFEVGRLTDIFVTDNLKLLFERTVLQRRMPKSLAFEQGTDKDEAQSIAEVFDPNKSDFIPMAATCCTAYLFGKTRELSPKKRLFVELFRGLVDDKISEMKTQFPELPTILSNAAYAACYARYVEHNGKIGLLFTPYLGFIRALNRSMLSEAWRIRTEIDQTYNGYGHIFSMLYGLNDRNFFTRISDNPNVFKIYPMVVDWFVGHLPLPVDSVAVAEK